MTSIKTAVFPVGGMGTRFLPATKAMPKEMLPIVDRPLIKFVVDEAREAGIERLVFVTGHQKHAIENHFDHMFELEHTLRKKGKEDVIAEIQAPSSNPGNILFTRQMIQAGLGHAVWCARHVIQNDPFAVLLADDFIDADKSCIKQILEAFYANPGNYIATMSVEPDQVQAYGIAEPSNVDELGNKVVALKGLVEKPRPADAPSNLAVVGRYVLMPTVITRLATQKPGSGGEIQLADSIAADIELHSTYALCFDGIRFDCGSKQGFVAATQHMAQKRGLN